MELFNRADRLGINWISNTAGHTTKLQIDDDSYCIVLACLVWYSKQPVPTVELVTDNSSITVKTMNTIQDNTSGHYIQMKEITFFTQTNVDSVYTLTAPAAAPGDDPDALSWHLPVIYNSPFLPPCHICLHVQSETDAPLWEPWLAALPEITTDHKLSAELHVLADNDHQTYTDHFSMEQGIAAQPLYATARAKTAAPYLLVHRVQARNVIMKLEHSADPTDIKPGGIVNCRTVITNTGWTTCMYIQYRTTLLKCARFIPDSLVINGIPIAVMPDSQNVITIILRNMPPGDMLDITFKMEIYTEPEVQKTLMSSVLDYHFAPVDGRSLIGNQPSNEVEFLWSGE